MMLPLLLVRFGSSAVVPPPLQCTPAAEKPQWPTFHFFNNITRGSRCYCSPAPCTCPGGSHQGSAELVMEPLNDANAIFQFKGLFHVMMQAGGGNWTHGVAATPAGPWFTEIDALNRATQASLPWDSHQGPCDGSASFPDLGHAPFNGSTPVIMYGPDCNVPITEVGDAPRVEVALPKDPSDAFLRDWVKQVPGPVVFDGTPCSFPGHVWKSTATPNTWNMICALDGKSPWVRFSSTTPTLMKWKLADSSFMVSAETGQPQDVSSKSGAYFQTIPNPKVGGPTHMINSGSAGPMLLGTFDQQTEKLRINNTLGPQVLDSSSAFRWGAVGRAADGRLLMVAWVQESGRCGDGQPRGFGACARSVTSCARELVFDHATDQLVARPVEDYVGLRNATFVGDTQVKLLPNSSETLPVPAAAGGALDVLVSFDLASLGVQAAEGFGLAVRAPQDAKTPGGIALSFSVSPPEVSSGERTVLATQGQRPQPSPAPRGTQVLPFMNDTDLGGGDYKKTHLPAGTDPHKCATLCLQDAKCMAWVYVIRGKPAGSGDCLFKNENHGCPSASPQSSSQGLCVAGRGHEPVNHHCNPAKPPAHSTALPPVRLLRGETLDVRMLVDRPLVEIFINGGRAAFTHASADFSVSSTGVRLFNDGGKAVQASNVSVHGMGCGWTTVPPLAPAV